MRSLRRKRRALCAWAWAIGIGTAALGFGAGAAQALPIGYRVTLQPIQVCRDDGTGCANPTRQLFETATDKVWAQAGIDVSYLPFETLDSTAYLSIEGSGDPSFGNLVLVGGHGQSADPFVLNLWFVASLGDARTLGLAYLGYSGIAIADLTFTGNWGNGYLAAIAHEIGHNLGLDHVSDPTNLMNPTASGAGLADIYPDGAQMDQLDAAQVATAQASPYTLPIPTSVPEPDPWMLVSLGLVGLAVASRRRSTPA